MFVCALGWGVGGERRMDHTFKIEVHCKRKRWSWTCLPVVWFWFEMGQNKQRGVCVCVDGCRPWGQQQHRRQQHRWQQHHWQHRIRGVQGREEGQELGRHHGNWLSLVGTWSSSVLTNFDLRLQVPATFTRNIQVWQTWVCSRREKKYVCCYWTDINDCTISDFLNRSKVWR